VDRYDVGLNVTGQIEVKEGEDPKEALEDVVTQIIAHTDLFWAHVDVDWLEPVNKEENIREVNPT
jgi:hypothetical protein